MQHQDGRKTLFILLLVLVLGNGVVWYWWGLVQQHTLRVSFLNIGQGDSILIVSPTGQQVLVDGGPDRSVLRELGKVIGPLDRSIDMVVETHPDKDHIFGLTPVLEQYAVKHFMEPGRPDDTNASRALTAAVAREPDIDTRLARRGQRILIGGGAYIDVLYPYQQDVSTVPTNDASVVLHVVYGDTSVLLTGDLPSVYEDKLVALDAHDGELHSDVLKAGHHGSKYSTDALWLTAVAPKVVVISAGKDNPYGHPSKETLARIQRANIPTVSTIDKGTITFVSDGTTIRER